MPSSSSYDTSSTAQAAAVISRQPKVAHVDVTNDGMTTTSTAPNSPPQLSGSRSSKSSSQSSATDGILSDISHFEEIGLKDDARMSYVETYASDHYSVAKRPLSHRIDVGSLGNPPTQATRELTATKKLTYPSLHGQIKTATHRRRVASFNGPRSAGPLKRGFTSPSVSAFPLPSPHSENKPRTWSSSPTHRATVAARQSIANGLSLRPSLSPRSALAPPARRCSWQPTRKSIKELEAEYHDSDDDLPDDASLWNVPMSPQPASERYGSAKSSRSGSTERGSASNSPMPLPLSHTVSAPDTSPYYSLATRSLPQSRPTPPRTSSLNVSNSSLSNPPSPHKPMTMRNTRAKSWTLAMSELSEEAKILQEALEYHAEAVERKQGEKIQEGNQPAPTSIEATTKSGIRTNVINLPPVQKGSLDFMPISKEKEAFLSRTRPSWLPPKDPREEKKHLKEYQRIMAASVEAEKNREQRSRMERCQKDDTREALNRIWEQYVFPPWKSGGSEHRTQELWWRGVSPKVRGKVWERAIGNPLGLSDASYQKALQRAKDIQARSAEELGEKEKVMKGWLVDIEKDAETAFPELNLFRKEGPMWRDLVDVCGAHACYRSDVGFLHGVHVSDLTLSSPPFRLTDMFFSLLPHHSSFSYQTRALLSSSSQIASTEPCLLVFSPATRAPRPVHMNLPSPLSPCNFLNSIAICSDPRSEVPWP